MPHPIPKQSIHRSIIKLTSKIGLKPNIDGQCYSVAGVGVQAILAKTTAKFDSHCNALAEIHPDIEEDELNEAIDNVRTRNNEGEVLDEEERSLLEMPAFLESIDVNFDPANYKRIYSSNKQTNRQDITVTAPYTLPPSLEAKGGG
jgi:hypothetical protein